MLWEEYVGLLFDFSGSFRIERGPGWGDARFVIKYVLSNNNGQVVALHRHPDWYLWSLGDSESIGRDFISSSDTRYYLKTRNDQDYYVTPSEEYWVGLLCEVHLTNNARIRENKSANPAWIQVRDIKWSHYH